MSVVFAQTGKVQKLYFKCNQKSVAVAFKNIGIMPYLNQCYLMSRFGIRKSLAIIACVDVLNYQIV
jgi:hypothetical protein